MSASSIQPPARSPASPPFHQTMARQSASGGCTSASRRANSAGEHRLGARQLADVAGLHQQAAGQAPQRQRRHVAGPAVHQQPRAEGAHRAALDGRLELVEHLGIGEVLGDEAVQLRRAKGLQEGVEAQPHHLGVVAGHRGQQPLGLAPQRVARIEQARDGGVDDRDDARDRQRLQVRAPRPRARAARAPAVCARLQHRHPHLQRCAPAPKASALPCTSLVGAQARQVAGASSAACVHGCAAPPAGTPPPPASSPWPARPRPAPAAGSRRRRRRRRPRSGWW